MTWRWLPSADDARSKIIQRRSDPERWGAETSYDDTWDARAELAADYLQDVPNVLDLGAGKMGLQRFLPERCLYQPADLAPLSPDGIQIDLNADELPDGPWAAVSMLGVLEYLFEPGAVLSKIRRRSPRLVFSYSAILTRSETALKIRRDVGWVSDLNEAEIVDLIEEAGWEIRATRTFFENWAVRVIIFDCRNSKLV